MAIYKAGGGVASISGSIAGVTFSRNAGGPYMRNRAVPVNPNTPQQQAIRSLVAQLTAIWSGTLTQAARDAWEAYNQNVLLPNPLGDPRMIGALPHYIRSNVPRVQAGLDRVDAAPTTYDLGDYTLPTIASITAPTSLSLNFTESDPWVGTDDAALLVYTAIGKSPATQFHKGPYRYAGKVEGDSTTPPTSPAAITCAFTLTAGQSGFIYGRVSYDDGRLTTPFRARAVVV